MVVAQVNFIDLRNLFKYLVGNGYVSIFTLGIKWIVLAIQLLTAVIA